MFFEIIFNFIPFSAYNFRPYADCTQEKLVPDPLINFDHCAKCGFCTEKGFCNDFCCFLHFTSTYDTKERLLPVIKGLLLVIICTYYFGGFLSGTKKKWMVDPLELFVEDKAISKVTLAAFYCQNRRAFGTFPLQHIDQLAIKSLQFIPPLPKDECVQLL